MTIKVVTVYHATGKSRKGNEHSSTLLKIEDHFIPFVIIPFDSAKRHAENAVKQPLDYYRIPAKMVGDYYRNLQFTGARIHIKVENAS